MMRESIGPVPMIHSVSYSQYGLWMSVGKVDSSIGAKAGHWTVPAAQLGNIMSFSTACSRP